METTASPKAFELAAAHPLDQFYARAGRPLPPLSEIEGEAVPEPFRTLLVHRDDMTPTLEKFHKLPIHLRVIASERKGNEYFRNVVLLLNGTNQPVEFGAIKINLHLFPETVQKEILAEKLPLGHLLAEHQVKHSSRPDAFLRIASDELINQALHLSGAQVLFGRHNLLLDPQDRPLAEILEILPPGAAKL